MGYLWSFAFSLDDNIFKLLTLWCFIVSANGSASGLYWFSDGVALPKSLNSGIWNKLESFKLRTYGFAECFGSENVGLAESWVFPKLNREL